MSFLCEDFQIKCLWVICDNNEYDDELWDMVFKEEGIIPEEDFEETDDVKNILLEFNSMTDLEYYNKYYK